MLFITSQGRKLHPKLIDFLYGRTMTELICFKMEYSALQEISNDQIQGLYGEITIRQDEISHLRDMNLNLTIKIDDLNSALV